VLMLTVLKEEFEERVCKILKGQKHYCETCDEEMPLRISYIGYSPDSDRYYAVIKCSGCLEFRDIIWSRSGSSEIDGSAYGIVNCSCSSRHQVGEEGG